MLALKSVRMTSTRKLLPQLVVRWVARLRFPYLVALTVGLFLIDLVVPDVIPFIDELLLGLAALILSQLKRPEPRASAE